MGVLACRRFGLRFDNPTYVTERLNLEHDEFFELMQRDDNIAGLRAVGSPSALTHLLDSLDQRFIKGVGISNKLYSS